MRDVVILFVHLIVTMVRLAGPGGLRSIVAESVLVKHQLRILNRGRKRAPNLRAVDRIITGLCTLFMRPVRVLPSRTTTLPNRHPMISLLKSSSGRQIPLHAEAARQGSTADSIWHRSYLHLS